MVRMKRYLGDGVFAEHQGDRVVLTTEDGIAITNTIVLEFDVVVALIEFARDPERRRPLTTTE
jgi:hypothetical protein